MNLNLTARLEVDRYNCYTTASLHNMYTHMFTHVHTVGHVVYDCLSDLKISVVDGVAHVMFF